MIFKEWESWGGKKIQLVVDKGTSLYKLQFNPGGELPQELSGFYTQEKFAEAAVSKYLDGSKPKEKK